MRIAIYLAVLAASLHADNGNHGFTASLKNCTELIGFGPVPFAAARALVPASYALVPFDGSAGLVVRASRCEAVGVDNSAEKAALVAQIGIAVISPDGTGDINNYTLSYATDRQQLAQALSQAGLPAVLDRAVAYEFTPGFALHTSRFSMLGSLIGGNTDASFVFFNARGVFTAGSLVASVR